MIIIIIMIILITHRTGARTRTLVGEWVHYTGKATGTRFPVRPICPPARPPLPVSVKKAPLRRNIPFWELVRKAPNRGLQSGFCRRVAGQRTHEKERILFHRHRYGPSADRSAPLRSRPAGRLRALARTNRAQHYYY